MPSAVAEVEPTQMLAAGKLPQSQYGQLPGFTGVRMTHPLTHMFAMLVGMRGCGKTSLIQSLPSGYTVNLDLSSTSRFVRGTVWPGIDPTTGCAITNDGSKVNVTWEVLRDNVFQPLIDLAEADKPRPTTIFIDSVDGIIPLITDYVARSAEKESFYDMDGRRAWGIAYDHLTTWFNRLRNHGYGLWLISHVVHRMLPVGEGEYASNYDLTLTDGMWRRVDWSLEMIAGIEIEKHTEEEVIERKPFEGKGGKMITPKPRILQKTVTKRMLYLEGGTFGDLLKQRIGNIEPIELPAANAWQALESAYNRLLSA